MPETADCAEGSRECEGENGEVWVFGGSGRVVDSSVVLLFARCGMNLLRKPGIRVSWEFS